MNSITLRGKPHIMHRTKKERHIFVLLNLSLLIGSGILVVSLVYLLFHLSTADKTVYFSLPGIFAGIIFIVIYAVGIAFSLKKGKGI